MLIMRNQGDDHPVKGPNTSVHTQRCPWSWTFSCYGYEMVTETDSRTGKARRTRVSCTRLRTISCAHGQHIPLDLACVQIVQEGWRLVSPEEDGGGWRCSRHA